MATLTAQPVWGSVQRPWGWEVRVDFADDEGRIHNEVLTFPVEPPARELDAAVAVRLALVERRLAAEALVVPEPTREELVAKVAVLEAEKAALIVERDALVAEKPVAEVGR